MIKGFFLFPYELLLSRQFKMHFKQKILSALLLLTNLRFHCWVQKDLLAKAYFFSHKSRLLSFQKSFWYYCPCPQHGLHLIMFSPLRKSVFKNNTLITEWWLLKKPGQIPFAVSHEQMLTISLFPTLSFLKQVSNIFRTLEWTYCATYLHVHASCNAYSKMHSM